MLDWIDVLWDWIATHPGLSTVLAVGSVAMFIGSILTLPWLVARLPVDYFIDPKRHASHLHQYHPLVYHGMLVLKNLVGWILILAGIAMLVLPGQGLLTMLVGVMMSDFPGKFRLERSLACRPSVLGALNWLRAKAGHPPLLPPRHPDGSPCG